MIGPKFAMPAAGGNDDGRAGGHGGEVGRDGRTMHAGYDALVTGWGKARDLGRSIGAEVREQDNFGLRVGGEKGHGGREGKDKS